jgi:hypothetical protein
LIGIVVISSQSQGPALVFSRKLGLWVLSELSSSMNFLCHYHLDGFHVNLNFFSPILLLKIPQHSDLTLSFLSDMSSSEVHRIGEIALTTAFPNYSFLCQLPWNHLIAIEMSLRATCWHITEYSVKLRPPILRDGRKAIRLYPVSSSSIIRLLPVLASQSLQT